MTTTLVRELANKYRIAAAPPPKKEAVSREAKIVIDFYKNVYLPALPDKYYTGKPLEKGGTSINTGFPAGIAHLMEKGFLNKKQVICDYGAGPIGRVANPLREKGFKVYAYDPFNGTDSDGWKGVSKTRPKEKFDVCFSCYVLNVVPEPDENDIISKCYRLAPTCYHVVRNKDIYISVQKALYHDPSLENLTEDEIMAFCIFGVQTSKGFQRIPVLEDKGWGLIKTNSNWKVYGK